MGQFEQKISKIVKTSFCLTHLFIPSAPRFTNHWRGFTCNGGLVYSTRCPDDFTVTWDNLPGFYDRSIPGPLRRVYLLNLVAFC